MFFYSLVSLSFIVFFVSYKKRKSDPDEYALTQDRFSTFTLVATVVSTFVGGATILGTLEDISKKSFLAVIPVVALSFQCLILALISSKANKIFKDDMTLGDAFLRHYGPKAKQFYGLIWSLFCLGVLTAQTVAMGKTLQMLFPISYHQGVISGVLFVLSYCLTGGLSAVVRTDLIQFLMILVAMILLLFVSIFHPDTSFHWDGLVHAPKGQWILRGREIFFLTFMGSFLTPPIFQRIKLSGEKRGFQVFALSSLGILGIGLASGVCGLIASQEASHESTLNSLLSLMENYWPMGPIVLLGILAAMLSTSDSLVNSLAVTLVRDVFRLNEKKTSPLIWSMFTPMLLAGLLALSESGIWGILFKSYTLWAPTLLIPLLALFVGKTVSHQSFFTGNFVGLSCSLLGMVMPEAFLSLTAVELGVGLHLIFYISAYQWEKRKK